MTRRHAPQTRAIRLVEQLEAAGRRVAKVIVEGDRIEVVLQGGETAEPDQYEVWRRARAVAGRA